MQTATLDAFLNSYLEQQQGELRGAVVATVRRLTEAATKSKPATWLSQSSSAAQGDNTGHHQPSSHRTHGEASRK